MGNWDVELNPNKDGVKTELLIKQDVVNLIDELNAISFYEANEHSRKCYYDIRNAVIAMQPVASCSDAISRQGLLDTIDRFCDLGKRQLKEIVRDLPPVTPKHTEITLESALDYLHKIGWLQRHDKEMTKFALSLTPKQRTGHWIETAEEYYKAVNEYGGGVNEDTPYFVDDIACSECLSMFSVIDNETERFDCCPHCGAKMEEMKE